MCIFDNMKGFFTCLAKGLPILVTLASVATAVIPNPAPEAMIAIQMIHKIADVVALNSVGHNAQNSQNTQDPQ